MEFGVMCKKSGGALETLKMIHLEALVDVLDCIGEAF